MKRQRQSFDMQKEIADAVQFVWDDKQKRQKEETPGSYRYSTNFYFTASEIEHRVRCRADELMMGYKYGECGYNGSYGSGVRIQGLQGRTLLTWVRQYLLHQVNIGKLRIDDPSGRATRTITSARFRPADCPLSETEVQTRKKRMQKEAKPALVHFKDGTNYSNARSLCTAAARKKQREKQRGYFRNSRRSPSTRLTDKQELVTCPRCRKLLEQNVT